MQVYGYALRSPHDWRQWSDRISIMRWGYVLRRIGGRASWGSPERCSGTCLMRRGWKNNPDIQFK